jgi:hypothetical protein
MTFIIREYPGAITFTLHPKGMPTSTGIELNEVTLLPQVDPVMPGR